MTLRTARRAGFAALALSLGLTLTACSDDTSDDAPTDAGTAAATESSPDAPADDGATDGSDDGADDGSASDDDAQADAVDPTTSALQAVATAQSDAGGTAYSVDKDGVADVWEVGVAVEDGSVEVTVDATGAEVQGSTPDDLDAEDRQALDDAKVALPEAIQRVVGEMGGTLDDAELDVDDGTGRWNVSILTQDDVEEDYLVDVADGTVTQDD